MRFEPKRSFVDASIFIVLLASAGHLWPSPTRLTLLYVAVSAYLLWTRRSPSTFAYFLVGFCLGPTAEFYAVKNGAWIYSGTDGLPLWLPFGWGISGILLKTVGDSVTVGLEGVARRLHSPGMGSTAPGVQVDPRGTPR